MRIGMLIAGFLILANPVIYLIDFLPDVIGMALIVLGLTKVSYLVGKLEQARALYQKLIIVEAVNLFSFAIVAMSPGNEKPTMALLLAFAFGVLELIFFIPQQYICSTVLRTAELDIQALRCLHQSW